MVITVEILAIAALLLVVTNLVALVMLSAERRRNAVMKSEMVDTFRNINALRRQLVDAGNRSDALNLATPRPGGMT